MPQPLRPVDRLEHRWHPPIATIEQVGDRRRGPAHVLVEPQIDSAQRFLQGEKDNKRVQVRFDTPRHRSRRRHASNTT